MTSGKRRAMTGPSSRITSAPTLDSYNHPNAAIEPRIPGIFQYYSVAEDELAKGYCRASTSRRRKPPMPSPPPGRRSPTRSGATADQALQGLAGHVGSEHRGSGGTQPPALSHSARAWNRVADAGRSSSRRDERQHLGAAPGVRAGDHLGIGGASGARGAAAGAGPRGHAGTLGFANWRPTLYAYVLWADLPVLGAGPDARRTGQAGAVRAAGRAVRAVAGGLSAALRAGHRVFRLEPRLARRAQVQRAGQRAADVGATRSTGTRCCNMVWYCLAILVEYAIAFGLALLLNAQIRARKFFRVAFLMPLML